MKKLLGFEMKILLTVMSLSVLSCSIPRNTDDAIESFFIKTPVVHNKTIGSWLNIHEKNIELAGVRVQQFPDSSLEAPAWEGKHPAMILFVMWDGRVNQVGYKPSGKVEEDFWWDINDSNHDFSYIWEQLDYAHGSDPTFETHSDPRKPNSTH